MSAGSLPQSPDPAGEVTALPQIYSWIGPLYSSSWNKGDLLLR